LSVFFEPLQEFVCVVGLVELDDVRWVVRVDLVDVFAKLAARLCLEVLNLLETATLDEGALCLEVLGKDLGKLGTDVGQDVVGGASQEGFESGYVRAHLDNVFQGLL